MRRRHEGASRPEKIRILDEFVKTTGYHLKHVLRLTSNSSCPKERAEPRRAYDAAVREALTRVWEAGDRICGKRLKVALPCLVHSLEAHGHLALDTGVRERLLAISPASIDRVLTPV